MAEPTATKPVRYEPDQLRAACVGGFGNSVVRTPAIDALAEWGVRLADAARSTFQ